LLRAILAYLGLVVILHPAALGATPGGRGGGKVHVEICCDEP